MEVFSWETRVQLETFNLPVKPYNLFDRKSKLALHQGLESSKKWFWQMTEFVCWAPCVPANFIFKFIISSKVLEVIDFSFWFDEFSSPNGMLWRVSIPEFLWEGLSTESRSRFWTVSRCTAYTVRDLCEPNSASIDRYQRLKGRYTRTVDDRYECTIYTVCMSCRRRAHSPVRVQRFGRSKSMD